MIALLMGSFNPIHNGHIAIAEYTLHRRLADEVWFVVSPQNPLKSPDGIAPFEHRLRMVEIATAPYTGMKVCDIERHLPEPSYTVNTLRELHRLHPKESFVILAGSDIKEQLPLWREPDEVSRLAGFLIYPRGDVRENCSPEMDDAPLMDVSSTDCRADIYSTSANVPTQVITYIREHKLYADEYYYSRGMEAYGRGEFGAALNDFNDVLDVNPSHTKAQAMKTMAEDILGYRYTDIYNP